MKREKQAEPLATKNPSGYRESDLEVALAFEQQVYPHASPETQRLLLHARGAIRKFLDSDLGR